MDAYPERAVLVGRDLEKDLQETIQVIMDNYWLMMANKNSTFLTTYETEFWGSVQKLQGALEKANENLFIPREHRAI